MSPTRSERHRRFRQSLPFAALTLLFASSAGAEPDEASASKRDEAVASASERDEAEWYGWQIMAADVAGLVTGFAVAASYDGDSERRPTDGGLVAASWLGVGAVAAPAIHYAHGSTGQGLASLGLRLIVPPLTGIVGFIGSCLSNERFDEDCRESGFSAGALFGLAGVAALDIAFLGREQWRRRELPERSWYGSEILILDGAALVGGAYFALNPPKNDDGKPIDPRAAIWVPGFLVGLIGAPILHATHGEWLRAFGSLGARALIGPMGAVPGIWAYCSATGGVTGCAETGALYGLLGGLLAVDLFDALVLAYEPSPKTDSARDLPLLTVGPGFVALGGRFQ
jgi:hypothetical protein